MGLTVGLIPLPTGCAGGGLIHVIPLGHQRISTSTPLVERVSLDEGYFWINENNELCIALRRVNRPLFGEIWRKEFSLTLVLEGLPEDRGRDYRVDRATLRCRTQKGYEHTRVGSLNGIVTVWDFDEKRLRGRFRLAAKQQSYSVLTGWGSDQQVLLLGEFRAMADARRGLPVLTRTEEGGLSREAVKPRPVQGPDPAERAGLSRTSVGKD